MGTEKKKCMVFIPNDEFNCQDSFALSWEPGLNSHTFNIKKENANSTNADYHCNDESQLSKRTATVDQEKDRFSYQIKTEPLDCELSSRFQDMEHVLPEEPIMKIEIKEEYAELLKTEKLSLNTKSKETNFHVTEKSSEHFSCEQCSKCFLHINDYEKHKASHTKKKKQVGTTKKNSRHVKSDKILPKTTYKGKSKPNAGADDLKCPICSATFTFKGNLDRHKKIHTEKKEFACKLCNKAFRRTEHLQVHMTSHSNERNFLCDICNRQFKRLTALKTHMITHKAVKEYVCKYCNKAYQRKDYLTEHLTTHTNEKKYECDSCGLKFISKRYVRLHIQVKHMKKWNCKKCRRRFFSLSHKNTHKCAMIS